MDMNKEPLKVMQGGLDQVEGGLEQPLGSFQRMETTVHLHMGGMHRTCVPFSLENLHHPCSYVFKRRTQKRRHQGPKCLVCVQ
ncbi:hypothetical protein HMI55_007043 [Coelomomyces lativittatus]|nr:hypothetical protein HMI55_007043 [Coelomomyces lativittatus]